MADENARKREIDALLTAMDTFDLQEGLILADEAEDEIKIGDWKIIVKPFWVWLLE